MSQELLIVTTETIPGQTIRACLGAVSSEIVVGTNYIHELVGTISEIADGRSQTYELVISTARAEMMKMIASKAREMGGNAIVALRVGYHSIDEDGALTMIAATGTAVKIDEPV